MAYDCPLTDSIGHLLVIRQSHYTTKVLSFIKIVHKFWPKAVYEGTPSDNRVSGIRELWSLCGCVNL